MQQTNMVRMNPMEATTVRVIPPALVRLMFTMGNFSHRVPSLFGLVSGSHAVQLVDPISALMVPWGHLTQSQQHGEVVSFSVPGTHSVEQKDTGVDRVFQRKCDVLILSLGVLSLFQVPIVTFLRRASVAGERWTFMMLYEAEKGSPNLSTRTFPVKPSKLTLLRYFCRSRPLIGWWTEGQLPAFRRPCLSLQR